MKIYIKYLTYTFFKSFFYVVSIMMCLVFIMNLLSELEFFKDINIGLNLTLFLSLLNSPSMIFEMFPFIFLITTQLFFVKLFKDNEIDIFKYSGLKNTNILFFIGVISIITGILITTLIYNLSSNFKNFYLDIKSKYTSDGKYLAVITKNGLWIKDKIGDKIYIINSSEIEGQILVNNFITEFDDNYNVTKNIRSQKIDITKKIWKIYDAKVYKKNNYETKKLLQIKTNFDYKRIQSLYSNLSSLDIFQLYDLRKNYKRLNYSLTEVDLQLLKLALNPIYFLLMTIFSSLIMLRIKKYDSTTFKISLGLFFSVIIYYINNFFFVMGSTERISIHSAVIIPLILLSIINFLMCRKINEK